MASAVANLSALSRCPLPSPKRLAAGPAAGRQQGPVGRASWRVRAVDGDGRDTRSLDQLQRAASRQPSQMPKRRIAQAAPIGLWDRFPTARTVQQMMDTMERIMEDPFAYSSASFPSLNGEESLGGYRRGRTPWEIREAEGEYKMRFDMPGMMKKDVKLSVEDKMLVIKAEKQPKEGKNGEGEEEEEWSARSYGRYNSRIALPDNVAIEKINAEVKDGVLYITIPKVLSSNKVLNIDVQ